jgi:hypothetical protein
LCGGINGSFVCITSDVNLKDQQAFAIASPRTLTAAVSLSERWTGYLDDCLRLAVFDSEVEGLSVGSVPWPDLRLGGERWQRAPLEGVEVLAVYSRFDMSGADASRR